MKHTHRDRQTYSSFWRGCRPEFGLALLVSAGLQVGVLVYAHHEPTETGDYRSDEYESAFHLRRIAVRFEETFYPRGRVAFQMPNGGQRECCTTVRRETPSQPLRVGDAGGKASAESKPEDRWKVEARDISVVGSMGASMARRIVDKRVDELAGCFSKGVEGQAIERTFTTVSVTLNVSSDGDVSSMEFRTAASGALVASESRQCIRESVRRWEFLTFGEPGTAVVRIRIVATRKPASQGREQ
jgi:hypothetical protein